jgi:hypothetical protein
MSHHRKFRGRGIRFFNRKRLRKLAKRTHVAGTGCCFSHKNIFSC